MGVFDDACFIFNSLKKINVNIKSLDTEICISYFVNAYMGYVLLCNS